jgi:hypothetical protein
MIEGNTSDSTANLGNFVGSLVYTDLTSTSADLTVTLTNTSPVANGGFITAFVLNNPVNLITGITLVTSPTASGFALIGGPTFQGQTVNGSPYGQFDFGASTGGAFEGGGNPNTGLGVGVTGTFTFQLTGTSLDTLSEASFDGSLSSGTGIGMGAEFFAARFRGFNDGGSDKVPAEVTQTVIPEPSAMVLFCLGGVGAVSFIRRRRSKAAV